MAYTRLSACLLLALVASQAAAQTPGLRSPMVPKPTMGSLGQTLNMGASRATGDGPTVASLLAAAGGPAKQPNYSSKGPDLTKMAESWQNAIDAAGKARGVGATSEADGWSINDVVKALQTTITKFGNGTISGTSAAALHAAYNGNGTAAAAANETEAEGPAFDEFAGNLLCKNGLKFANCSGVNPCKGHKCFPGSMCMVDMCGECSAKCVTYAELGAGLNKVLSSVGLSNVKADLPTPNLPVVDKIVGGVQSFTKSFLPKCPANTVLDITLMRTLTNPCKACAPGTVAKENDARCGVCGKGRYADLKSSTCRWCPAGAFGPNTTGNERCLACPANTYTDRAGQSACLPCAAGFSTRGLRGQKACSRVNTVPAGY